MNNLEKSVVKEQNVLLKKIEKLEDVLTLSEYNLMNLLIRNCLLLDITKEVDKFGNKRITAYDLERKIIFLKILQEE